MTDVERRVEFIEIARLRPSARNARTHSGKQINQIARSIERFGFTNPVLVDDWNNIVAGHGRVAAAGKLGHREVPCLRINRMSDADRRAYVIADNKLALNAGWDVEILAIELADLIELDFEIGHTGFDQPEIDRILFDAQEASVKPAGREDDYPPSPEVGDAVTKVGDLWELGRHRLLCGDAKDPDIIDQLMEGAKADMVFTDSPYNVPIAGHVVGLGRIRHREFAEASGEMSIPEFTGFLTTAFEGIERACRNGAIVFTCMDWRHLREVLDAGHAVFNELKNICVWSKSNAGMGTFYRSQHEMVLAWKVGDAPHTNNFGLGDKGRYRTNVWSYPGVNTFKADRMTELASHPTVKPVALVADAIRDVSNRGEMVLDVFGGSGTTLIAAERTGRIARLLEIDPTYCDVTVRRWEKLTGKRATLSGSGRSFEAVGTDRLSLAANAGVEVEA
jgi:DNA modification methylase